MLGGKEMSMKTAVSAVPAAPSEEASRHFAAQFGFETDCWDVHASLAEGADFVLLDVRGPDAYSRAHVPGAVNLPHNTIVRERMAEWPADTLFVVYCAGPHCNGGARAAVRLAELQRPVKLMAGGITGWIDEGFALESAAA
jgi:rhodanese-related sulfurtransferase